MLRAPHIRYEEKLFFGSSHDWARQHLAMITGSPRVLDVGPGSGVMGRLLAPLGATNLFALEVDPAAQAHARSIYGRVVGSLDELSGEKFTVVLLLDVLEHMSDPVQFLAQLKGYLAPNALILISVPNIVHWAVRLLVLCGRFEFSDRGPLDPTHLHFYSRRGFHRLLRATPGFRVVAESASILPLELMIPRWMTANPIFQGFSRLRAAMAHGAPNLCGYQHLAMLQYQETTV